MPGAEEWHHGPPLVRWPVVCGHYDYHLIISKIHIAH